MSEPRLDNHLKQQRKTAGLSQNALAAQVGVSRQAILAIEAGRNVPSTSLGLKLAHTLGCTVEDIFRLGRKSGDLVPVAVAPDPLGQHGDAHHLEDVVRVVVGPERNGTAGRPQLRDGRTDAAVRRHPRLVGDDGARSAEQCDLLVVDVARVRREQPGTEEAVPVQVLGRPDPVVQDHELVLGAALVQMDRVAQVVGLGEVAHRAQ